jgi:PPOX class probable F420-dependent enzyme
MTDTAIQTTNPAALFDPADPAHAKALDKLEHDLIAWFTTIGANGEPHSVPVWFLWRDGSLLVMSEPHTAKVKHVRRGSPVLVHLEGGEFGNDVVVLNGTAEISDRAAVEWLPEIRDVYAEKYADAIADYGMGLEDILEKFSTVMLVRPTKLMAW